MMVRTLGTWGSRTMLRSVSCRHDRRIRYWRPDSPGTADEVHYRRIGDRRWADEGGGW